MEILNEQLTDLYDGVRHGRIRDLPQALASLEADGRREAKAWSLVVRASAALLDVGGISMPSLAELAELEGRSQAERETGSLACVHLARVLALGLETDELRRVLELHRRLTHDIDEASEARLGLALGEAWFTWLTGDTRELDAELQRIERAARAAGAAGTLIDASALRALVAGSQNDLTSMVSLARRTSRMARAEELPAQEYLAHLVLGRARRASGYPHLALRIFGALGRVVSSAYRPWLRWELALAGDTPTLAPEAAPHASRTKAERSAEALVQTITSAMAGDRARFDHSVRTLFAATTGAQFSATEARELVAALDAKREVAESDAAIFAWCRATSALSPPSIQGLCVKLDDDEDTAEAFVLAQPKRPARRVLGIGAHLLTDAQGVRLRKTRRHQGRVETLVSVLACAGEAGLQEVDCFAQAYELVYEPDVHRGVFDVLLTRARAYLEGVGEITRGGGRIALHLSQAIVVADPRCAAPVHARLLRILARDGRANANDAAKHVGLSVRAVQTALKSLAEDGVCTSEKHGRQILYVLEDTTFSEATERLAMQERT